MILSLLIYSMIFMQEGEPWYVDRIAVKVNDKIITEQELLLTYQKQKTKILETYKGDNLQQELEKAWDDIMDEAVDQLLLYQKAVEEGIDISEETLDGTLQNQKEGYGLTQEEFEKMIEEQTGLSLAQYMEQTIRYQSGQRVVQSRVWGAIQIDDPEIAKYYTEHISEYTSPETFQIAEIVFLKGEAPEAAKAKADECLQKLKQGLDFNEAVQTYSEAASKAINGDLGELLRGDLNSVIEKASDDLKVGEVSPVIDMETSYYIIKLLNRTPAAPKPIDDVKEDVKAALREPRFKAALDKYLKELRESYLIEKLITKPSSGY